MSRKKRILIHSNSHTAFTGFGKNCKNILRYLHATGKYELFELANGVGNLSNPPIFPWGFNGSIPSDNSVIQNANRNPESARDLGYGLFTIDSVIESFKPDVYIGIEDIWAFSSTVRKPWWNKLNCMIWTTLDSLPLLPEAKELAGRIKHYYCWSSFAENAAKNLGITNLKTLHGSIDCRHFYKLKDSEKRAIRKRFNISETSFVSGFVFRNQLRKTVGDLIVAHRLFKDKYPETNPKLLLHTNWSEGWDIQRLCEDVGVPTSDILTTYVCGKCKHYSIQNFLGQNLSCPNCGSEKTFNTTSTTCGISEEQLNEVYNVMDMYVHPFTSGGQEIPIQEAKLCELITAVTNYTCGEEMCTKESGGLPLSWSPYREIGTQFIKASTSPVDIANKMEYVLSLSNDEKSKIGKIARKYVIDNYSSESIGEKLCKIIDEMPLVDYVFKNEKVRPNPDYDVNKDYETEKDFIKDLYKGILSTDVSDDDDGLLYWLKKLGSGENPASIVAYFRGVAKKEISEKFEPKLSEYIQNDYLPKIAMVIPDDTYIAFMCSCFVKSIKEKYPNHLLYVFCNKTLEPFFSPYLNIIQEILPKFKECGDYASMEGQLDNAGYFDICYILNESDFNIQTFSHNAMDSK